MRSILRPKHAMWLVATVLVLLLSSCFSLPAPRPTIVENVAWEELADKDAIQENDNRYVMVDVQFLGADIKAMPAQMLYSDIAAVVLMNHTDVGASYDEEVVSSLDSFLVGLPAGDQTDALMTEGQFGDTIRVTGLTKYVNAGFGSFQHLLLEVESFENLGQ
jgi:hypothetical protein